MDKEIKYDIVVAQDGSGRFTTISEALDSVNVFNQKRVYIFVKKGVYKEKPVVKSYQTNVALIGEDRDSTIITYDIGAGTLRPDGKKTGTFGTPTFTVLADDFRAENITFENSTGRGNGQAVALDVAGDRAVFVNCRMLGWQDTLLAGKGRQYYKNCYIDGHVDYIFGGATAVFDECTIVNKDRGYITAASTPKDQKYGYVFLNCDIKGETDDDSVYLGRPWRHYAHTAFINCKLGAHIKAEGWHNWKDESREATSRYAEYNSTGPGAAPDKRVGWSKQLTDEEAAEYTVENIFDGWIPE